MSQMTNYAENAYVDHGFRGTVYSKPTVLAVGLLTAAPTEAGGGTEVSGGSYARVALNPSNTNWTATQGGTSGASTGTSGATSNASAITFAGPTANWGTVVAHALYDATTGGNMITWEWLRPAANAYYGAIALASNDTVTAPGHTFSNGDTVICRSIEESPLPGNISADTIVYVISVSGNAFSLSATSGGAAINISTDGAMRILKVTPQVVNNGAPAPSFAPGGLNYIHR